MRRAAALVLAVLLTAAGACAGRAGGLPAPAGEVILTVSGDIEHTNQGDRAVFDRAMLEGLGLARLRTSTAWTDGVAEFEGVPAHALMAAVGGRGGIVVATALNDYKVKIPASDFERYPVLLALKMNGRALAVRDKGPIWIVYPRDSFPELQSAEINARWVWQLSRLDLR